jgi:hypothetical protein
LGCHGERGREGFAEPSVVTLVTQRVERGRSSFWHAGAGQKRVGFESVVI